MSRNALLSVFDKTGLVDLAQALIDLDFQLISTGGSFKTIAAAGLPVRQVADVTGHPEILDGRVKTLHPRIHGGLLADRSKQDHLQELERLDIAAIDLVVCNLYPFAQTVASSPPLADCLEMIDIGGPTMVRAAAKNFPSVLILVDPADYDRALQTLRAPSPEDLRLRRRLAAKAFAHVAEYDRLIADFLAEDDAIEPFPAAVTLELDRDFLPRYGENPHQAAAVYRQRRGHGLLGGMVKLHGKELSWNNLLDVDAARRTVALFDEPAVVIVKHNNPCGIGRGRDLVEAYLRALACDPVSAFGSIIAVNRPLDVDLAQALDDLFVEVITAPEVVKPAFDRLSRKKNLRILRCPVQEPAGLEWRSIDGGFLAQTPDDGRDQVDAWQVVTHRRPSADENAALELAWKAARAVKSNAIVLARRDQTIGIGAGQMSRVDACEIALRKAQGKVAGAVAASDAFFPFRDGFDLLADAGIKAVIQPGGSVRDPEVIAAADEKHVAMVFTARRHFRH